MTSTRQEKCPIPQGFVRPNGTAPGRWVLPLRLRLPLRLPLRLALRLRLPLLRLLVLLLLFGVRTARADGPQFESPPVHPVELSEDGTRLYAVHQADNRLLVFDLTQGPLPVPIQEIMVGLEPVTVRERTAGEVWVVNHLSDSISIVDLASGQVTTTLLVGDEPTDVVFAGNPERAFVCVSRENRIRIWDPLDLTAPPEQIALTQVTPLALVVSPDDGSVFVAALESGNNTTAIPSATVEAAGGPPPPNPPMDPALPLAPRVALIVQHDGTSWRDEVGGNWNASVPYQLHDHDVIRIDVPSRSIVQTYRGVGTTLFGIATHPLDGRLYVSNQEAFNLTRFEPNLRGRFVANRVTVMDPGTGTVVPQDLNSHIDYGNPSGSEAERERSLSIPTALVAGSCGTVYVAAFGSAKVGVLDEYGILRRRIDVGDGPCGLALDEARNRLYVARRIPGDLDVVDLDDDTVTTVGLGFDPTPDEIHAGRRRFYDGRQSSAHGDLSCASCHVYAGTDEIAWDLGDPRGEYVPGISQAHAGFHPMKGPMMTQPLKGLVDTDPFHWRGDRPLLADFSGTFVSLMGRAHEPRPPHFAELESFLLSLVYPPNPHRSLDGSLPNPSSGPNATTGEELFRRGRLVDGGGECVECHEQPSGAKRLVIPFVLLGEDEDQDLVVPHLRTQYRKVGFDPTSAYTARGYGYTHNGTLHDLQTFLDSRDFTFDSQQEKDDVEAFLLSFDTGTHAAVGAQWTMDGSNEVVGRSRVETLAAVADLGSVGLVAKGADMTGEVRGWAYLGGSFRPDRAEEDSASLDDLLALAGGGRAITFTAVYAGSEIRLGIDRDGDGYLDRDELDAGSDPGDPGSVPDPSDVAQGPSFPATFRFEPIWPNPAVRAARLAFGPTDAAEARLTGGMEERLDAESGTRRLSTRREVSRRRAPEGESGLPGGAEGRSDADGRPSRLDEIVASVAVFDVSGRRVRQLAEAVEIHAGRNEMTWDLRDDDGRAVPSGQYFVQIRANGETLTRRVVVRR